MSVYEFGDAHPIVKVWFDEDGWEWFRDLCRAELSANDLFLKDVDDTDAYLTMAVGEDDQ